MQHVSPLDMTIRILYGDLAAIDKWNQRRSKPKGEATSRGLHLNPIGGKQSSSTITGAMPRRLSPGEFALIGAAATLARLGPLRNRCLFAIVSGNQAAGMRCRLREGPSCTTTSRECCHTLQTQMFALSKTM